MKCCICGEEIEKDITGWDQGHNAEPVKKGRCCIWCNNTVVVPTRLERLFKKKTKPKK